MSGALRVGVVGSVRRAGPYVVPLLQDPRVDVVGVAEEAGAPAWIADGCLVARKRGVPRVDSVEDLLDPGRVDLVLVCSEPSRQAALAIQALEAGLHVVVDTPIAASLADAVRIAEAAERSGRACTVVNRTHATDLRSARAWVDAGHVGLPRHVDYESLSRVAHVAHAVERPRLLLDSAPIGGGELARLLCYGVDAVRYLTGLEATSVHAYASALFGYELAEAGSADAATVSLGLDRSVTATLMVGHVPFPPGPGEAAISFRLLGSHGHATGDDNKPAVVRYGSDGPTVRPIPAATSAHPLAAFFDHVVGSLLAGMPPEYTARDAVEAMRVVDAADRSVASSDVVALDR